MLFIWVGGLLMRWILPFILMRWMRRFQDQIQRQAGSRPQKPQGKDQASPTPIKGDYIDYEEIP
ncbi:MAG: hypothetical protein FJ336_00065 [Sphingomonadales bacterium]|nr:hypothetical protein [Sphingomonadales bacterium]